MNKTRLTKNRLIVIWSGISSITPFDKSDLDYKRFKFRENRKHVINNKKYINVEYD